MEFVFDVLEVVDFQARQNDNLGGKIAVAALVPFFLALGQTHTVADEAEMVDLP